MIHKSTSAAVIALVLLLALVPSHAAASTYQNATTSIVVPPKPTELANSTLYSVKVRALDSNGTKWLPVPLYQPHVEEINATTGSAKLYNSPLAYFDFDGAVEVSVTPDSGQYPDLDEVRVRPLSYGIEPSVAGREVTFIMKEPHHNVVVEINGNVFNVLHIWTNTIDKDAITEAHVANNSDIVYYGPGYHTLEEGHSSVNLTSGQTLYLAGGAVLKAGVSIINQTDVIIRGHGMLYNAVDDCVLIEYSSNVLVDGISVLNPGHYSLKAGSSKGITVRDFRGISAAQWGDGIDLFCMQDTVLERIFLRTSDDSIAIYQHRWNYYGDSSNITIRDSSLWADVAHPIHMGLHGNTENPETMSDVKFHNIDILDHREPQVDYQGCIAINAGDENLVENILFDNIRVEDFRLGMLLQMRVTYNPKYNTAPGRGIRNITI